MVAAAPNLTRVVGTIRTRASHPALEGWDVVTLVVARREAVSGQADLLAARAADAPLEVAVPQELLGEAGPGWTLDARVRLTTNGVLAEQRPAPGAFTVAAG